MARRLDLYTATRKQLVGILTRERNKYKEQVETIRQTFSVKGGAHTLHDVPEARHFFARGKTDAQLISDIEQLDLLQSREEQTSILKQQWVQYMNCLKINEQNKYNDFYIAYGMDPSNREIESIFNDNNFRECNEFLSKAEGGVIDE